MTQKIFVNSSDGNFCWIAISCHRPLHSHHHRCCQQEQFVWDEMNELSSPAVPIYHRFGPQWFSFPSCQSTGTGAAIFFFQHIQTALQMLDGTLRWPCSRLNNSCALIATFAQKSTTQKTTHSATMHHGSSSLAHRFRVH